jgi:hypothetical protein
MNEGTGKILSEDVTEIIRQRIDTVQDLQVLLDSVDLEDMDDWIIQCTNGQGTFLMNHHMIPSVAYGLTSMFLTIKDLAAKSADPDMVGQVMNAVLSAHTAHAERQ